MEATMLFFLLMSPIMAKYITHLDVFINEVEEKTLQLRDFKKIDVNLNEGAGGKQHLFGTKQSMTQHQSPGFRLHSGMTWLLDYSMWYFNGSTEYDTLIDTIIVEMYVTTNAKDEASKFNDYWERLTCDLNRNAGGNRIYIWMKREKQTYICDVIATISFGSDGDYFHQGYIRVDEDTNMGAGGAYVFIWYRQTTNQTNALTDLKVSTNDQEYQSLHQQNYKLVSVDLNQGTGGNQVYMWYKKEGIHPIKAIAPLVITFE